MEVTPEGTLALIADWPFERVHADNPNVQWWPPTVLKCGWMRALKGDGHWYFSPRVVDRAPWRVLRSGDVTMFQFYDIEGTAESTLAEARVSESLAQQCWFGGHFYGRFQHFRTEVALGWAPSSYDAATRTSIKVVPDGSGLTPAEMGLAAGTKVHQVYSAPVDQVAIVYLDEATARCQLPDLWLHGLEVRTWVGGVEHRIDEDYEPPPVVKPEWVRRLEG